VLAPMNKMWPAPRLAVTEQVVVLPQPELDASWTSVNDWPDARADNNSTAERSLVIMV